MGAQQQRLGSRSGSIKKESHSSEKTGARAENTGEQGWGKEWCWTRDLEGQMEREKRNLLISLLTLPCSKTRRKKTQKMELQVKEHHFVSGQGGVGRDADEDSNSSSATYLIPVE